MQRDKEYLLDIQEAAKLALTYIANKTKEDFLKDIQCQDAVIRRLEPLQRAHSPWLAAGLAGELKIRQNSLRGKIPRSLLRGASNYRRGCRSNFRRNQECYSKIAME